MFILVDVILDGQQVVGHGLQRQLVQQWRHAVEPSVQYQELRTRFLWTLAHSRLVSLRHKKVII